MCFRYDKDTTSTSNLKIVKRSLGLEPPCGVRHLQETEGRGRGQTKRNACLRFFIEQSMNRTAPWSKWRLPIRGTPSCCGCKCPGWRSSPSSVGCHETISAVRHLVSDRTCRAAYSLIFSWAKLSSIRSRLCRQSSPPSTLRSSLVSVALQFMVSLSSSCAIHQAHRRHTCHSSKHRNRYSECPPPVSCVQASSVRVKSYRGG